MMATKRDYYEILGLSKGAAKAEIKKAYRNLALKYHPDRVSADKKKEAEERFKEISEAYAVLSDDQKKAQYDQFGHAGIDSRYSSEDIFRGADFSSIFEDLGFGGSIFEDLFGGGGNIFGGGRSRRRGPRRGSDLQYDLEISFEEAAFGVEKSVTVPRHETCSECKGSGAAPGTSLEKCSKCKGAGQIRTQHGFGFVFAQTCDRCRGVGEIIKVPCAKCHGSGRVAVERKIQVRIPAGVETGSRLRISGEGEAGLKGGPRGDLYALLYVKPHAIFGRDDNNVTCEVPISFPLAALGGEREVPTLTGKVKMKIPAGTQSGKIFRLRGNGIQDLHGYGKGDQLVRIVVETPTNLSSAQKKLLKEFSDISGEKVHPISKSFMDKVRQVWGGN
ncbi:MAG: molecular chaperone DnaJ [Candidatus Omnitrophota bacterium]